jgi:N-acyl-L-homoserine lactone synthetase
MHGIAIGTIRVVPMGLGLTLTDTLLAQVPGHTVPGNGGAWEVGRLALAPEYRSDPAALKRCLFLALDYLCGQADATHLYASCSHVLSRLYRRFGFSPFATEVPLAGTEKTYTLIYGNAPAVLRALAPAKETEAQEAPA